MRREHVIANDDHLQMPLRDIVVEIVFAGARDSIATVIELVRSRHPTKITRGTCPGATSTRPTLLAPLAQAMRASSRSCKVLRNGFASKEAREHVALACVA